MDFCKIGVLNRKITMQILEKALTFDDVLLVPAHSTVLPREVNLTTKLSRNITLKLPLVAAAMDTVTESRLAIALAQEGGIGIIHKNFSPEEQAEEVLKVKRFESGILKDPITVSPNMNIAEVFEITRKRHFSGMPVLDENGVVVGIVTNRDVRFETDLNQKVSQVMTPQNRLVTVKDGASIQQAQELMRQHRLERVLVVDDDFHLKGLITVKDILKATTHPNSAKDAHSRLLAGAAIGTGAGTEERAERLIDAGVDVIVVDTAHGHSQGVLERVKWVKKHYPQIDVIGGNIATADAARALLDCGADGVKVGIGPGSICTTRIIAGVGVPQITAIKNVADALKGTNVPMIADGGIRYSGDIAKAIAAGADSVMLGGLFAGTEEAPGEVELFQGRAYKSYRGMGSLGAMQAGSSDRYFQEGTANVNKFVPEGIEGRVPYKGSVLAVIHQLIGGLRSSMGYLGCENIQAMQSRAQFVEITAAGVKESHVHDVQITKEAPNYHSHV